MVESLFDAKERFLAPDGVIIPERVELKVALVEEDAIYPECVDCWKPIDGIDYSSMREEAVKACYLTALSNRNLLSEPKSFFGVDFRENEWPKLEGKRVFNVCRSGTINGIALWFDALLTTDVPLSSGPWTRTHWKQCFAPLSKPMIVKSGEIVSVNIEMKLRTREDDSFNFEFSAEREC